MDNFAWRTSSQFDETFDDLIAACQHEVRLCETWIDCGQRFEANIRLKRAIDFLDHRLREETTTSSEIDQRLAAMRVRLVCTRVQALANGGDPLRAHQVSLEALALIDSISSAAPAYDECKMLVLFSCGLTYALSGELELAREFSGLSVPHARRILSEAPGAVNAISTHGIIEARFNLIRALKIFDSLDDQPEKVFRGVEEFEMHCVHNNMARLLLILNDSSRDRNEVKAELSAVQEKLRGIYSASYPVGRLPHAAASALLLGLSFVTKDHVEACKWFALAIVSAGKAQQSETLWRAQINFAQVQSLMDDRSEKYRAFAKSALQTLLKSLDAHPDPDSSRRMDLVRPAIAQAIRILAEDSDRFAQEIYSKFPSLKAYFEEGDLTKIRGERPSQISLDCLKFKILDIYSY